MYGDICEVHARQVNLTHSFITTGFTSVICMGTYVRFTLGRST